VKVDKNYKVKCVTKIDVGDDDSLKEQPLLIRERRSRIWRNPYPSIAKYWSKTESTKDEENSKGIS